MIKPFVLSRERIVLRDVKDIKNGKLAKD